jgi:hypothetical protein
MTIRNILLNATLISTTTLMLGCASAVDHTESVGSTSQALLPNRATTRIFDGVDDRVVVPHSDAYNFGSGDFTLEARVKLADASRSYEPLLSSRTSGYDGFLFVLYGNTLLLQLNGVPNYQSAQLPSLRDGKYHHLAVSRFATTITFYVDGVAQGTVTSPRSNNSTGPLYIGRDDVDAASLGGSVAEVRLWNVGRDVSYMQAAAKGTAVSGSSPGLVGLFYPDAAQAQTVIDYSTKGNNGWLGTDPARWDVADPSLEIRSIIELTPSSAARLDATQAAASPTPPAPQPLGATDQCGGLLINGVMDTFSSSTYSSLSTSTFHYFCDQQSKNLNLAVDLSGKVTIPIDGVPVELEADDKNSLGWQKVHTYCQQDASAMSSQQATTWLSSFADPNLLKAYLDCQRIVHPPVLEGSQTVSSDGKTIVFTLKTNILVNGQPDTLISDTFVQGASCSGALTVSNTVVPSGQGISAVCTRNGNDPVVFVVTTTEGTYIFNAGPSGVTGQAWVTGALANVVETKQQKCGDPNLLYVGSRTCLFGWCDDTQVGPKSLPVDSGFVFRENSCTLTDVSGFGNTTKASCWLTNNDTVVNGQFWRQKNHSARMILCAEEYRTDTTYTNFQSPFVDVYGDKNFEVRVGNAYEGKALHIKLYDNSILLQQLDAPVYAPPFTLVSKVADPLNTTYLIRIDQ